MWGGGEITLVWGDVTLAEMTSNSGKPDRHPTPVNHLSETAVRRGRGIRSPHPSHAGSPRRPTHTRGPPQDAVISVLPLLRTSASVGVMALGG